MMILGIDPGPSVTGVAWGCAEAILGWRRLIVPDLSPAGKAIWITDALDLLLLDEAFTPDLVAYEWLRGRNVPEAPALAVVIRELGYWVRQHKYLKRIYSPGHWRKVAIGNGRADKSETAGSLSLRYPSLRAGGLELGHDDVWDAIGITTCALAEAGKPAFAELERAQAIVRRRRYKADGVHFLVRTRHIP